jgi:hypothetical protein
MFAISAFVNPISMSKGRDIFITHKSEALYSISTAIAYFTLMLPKEKKDLKDNASPLLLIAGSFVTKAKSMNRNIQTAAPANAILQPK